jgi:hypothetical protein
LTIHIKNWKAKNSTICGVILKNRKTTRQLKEVTCDVCALRFLREGQKHGLDPINIEDWDLNFLVFSLLIGKDIFYVTSNSGTNRRVLQKQLEG